jgi:hypothetical protein
LLFLFVRGIRIMGQYYRFVNTTKQIESTIPLPFNFNLPYGDSSYTSALQ